MTQIARILGINTLSTSLVAQYTVPANTTTRITRMSVAGGATNNGVTIQIRDASANITKNLWNARQVNANTTVEIFDLILEAGDQIIARSASATDIDFIVMGIEDVL